MIVIERSSPSGLIGFVAVSSISEDMAGGVYTYTGGPFPSPLIFPSSEAVPSDGLYPSQYLSPSQQLFPED